jgi:Glycosyltransferase family 87
MTLAATEPAGPSLKWLPGLTPRLAVALAVLVFTTYALLTLLAQGHPQWLSLVAIGVFAAVAVACRSEATVAPMWLILAATAAIQLPGLVYGPITSDDVWRYVWDGHVQLAGIDPYRYAPLDPALEFLREPTLFPADGGVHINRPSVPTLYPPIAQAWFTLFAAITPWRFGVVGLQLGAALAVLVTTALLARFLGRRRGWALLYGASPVVAVEAASSAHLDAVAALCLFGFGWAAVRARYWLAGIFLGLAAGIKLVPLLLVPALLRGGRWRTAAGGVFVLVAGYVPHILAVGVLIWGYLPGYLEEEGYDGAERFALLFWLPPGVRTVAGLVVALALAVVAVRRSGHEPVLVTCSWLYGGAILVATPSYPWYALGYVVLVLMSRRLEWLAVWPAMYAGPAFSVWAESLAYGCALLVVVLAARRRATLERMSQAPSTPAAR